jgi:hypothetical protein
MWGCAQGGVSGVPSLTRNGKATVADDGEFTISPTDLAGWPAGNAEVSVRNESPNLFTVLAGSVDGVAVGATEVTQTVNMPSF